MKTLNLAITATCITLCLSGFSAAGNPVISGNDLSADVVVFNQADTIHDITIDDLLQRMTEDAHKQLLLDNGNRNSRHRHQHKKAI